MRFLNFSLSLSANGGREDSFSRKGHLGLSLKRKRKIPTECQARTRGLHAFGLCAEVSKHGNAWYLSLTTQTLKRALAPSPRTWPLPPQGSSLKIQSQHDFFFFLKKCSVCRRLTQLFLNVYPESCSLLSRNRHEPPKDGPRPPILFPRCHRPAGARASGLLVFGVQVGLLQHACGHDTQGRQGSRASVPGTQPAP